MPAATARVRKINVNLASAIEIEFSIRQPFEGLLV
jgi:hypothetical protein